jgi:hypothetical protein
MLKRRTRISDPNFSEQVPFCRRDGVATIPLSGTIGADDTT